MSDKVVKYKKPFSFNIGLIIFILIVFYVFFNIFSYLTKKNVSEYEVVQGSIASNTLYRGLAIREEEVITSNRNGYIDYFVSNGAKVSVRDLVYTIDSKGNISQALNSDDSLISLDAQSIKSISVSLDTFVKSYQSENFANAMQYKLDLESNIDQLVNNQMMIKLADDIVQAEENQSFFKGYSDIPGIVLYYLDQYEDVTVNNFTKTDLEMSKYSKTLLSGQSEVAANQPIYKLVKGEDWHLIIEIDQSMVLALEDRSSIKIRFCEDDFITNCSFNVIQKEENYFLDLYLKKGMIRYANERFIDIELIIHEKAGLKIPNSAITTKDFYKVPVDYFLKGGDSNSLGFLLREKNGDCSFVAPTIYYEEQGLYYYIDSEFVSDGDTIQLPADSGTHYVIGHDIGTLTGVYNINKGYAVFKQINILYQNEEYAIVEQKTTYGVALYDHIALDASSLKENELIVK